MYSALLSFCFRRGHWTRKLSAKYTRIFPVNENVSVRQKLSIKTILVSVIKATFKRKPTKQIGMQVPGPLHKIRSGLIFKIKGIVYKVEKSVVNTDVW